MDGSSDKEVLESKSKHFLNFFEKVKVEFPGQEYPSVEWVKAKSEEGAAFDCIEI